MCSHFSAPPMTSDIPLHFTLAYNAQAELTESLKSPAASVPIGLTK